MPAPTPRTTADLVKGIIEVEEGKDLTPFIRAANMLTTRACGAAGYTDGYVDSEMEIIERWLAAHFYAMNDNQLARVKAGSVFVAYQYKVNMGLLATMYGQQAIALDTAGGLASVAHELDDGRRFVQPSIKHIGITCRDERSYWCLV